MAHCSLWKTSLASLATDGTESTTQDAKFVDLIFGW